MKAFWGVAALCASTAFADTVPVDPANPDISAPTVYFIGIYERVGRDDADPAGLLNDLVRLDPEGDGLGMTSCATGSDTPLMTLTFTRFGDITNLLVSADGPSDLWCLYGNNGDNYPLLTCAGVSGTKFMLWPAPGAVCGP